MATSIEDAANMVRACRDNGVKLGLGFELRFHPAHLLARQLIAEGAIGRIGWPTANGAAVSAASRNTCPAPACGLGGNSRSSWAGPRF